MKYKIYKDGFTNCAHCEYYSKYERYEFEATDNAEAIKKAVSFQNQCDQKINDDGVVSNKRVPCLVNHISRYAPEKNEWVEM